MSPPKNILVIRLSALGDVAMAAPVLSALRHQYPSTRVTLLSKRFHKPLFEGIEGFTFVEADINGEHRGIVGIYRLSRLLLDYRFDYVLDIHDVLRSRALTSLLRLWRWNIAIARIHKGRNEKKKLVSDPHFFEPLKHTIERYTEVFSKAGFGSLILGEKASRLPKPRWAEKENILWDDRNKNIGLAPFAAHTSKAMPMDMTATLISHLDKIPNTRVWLFGGEEEAKRLEELSSQFDNCTSMAGRMCFRDELSYIARLDIMISVDSSNGHLAAMYGVPVMTIWANTHPYAGFAPYGQPAENQFIPDLARYPLVPTSVYGNKLPSGYEEVIRSVNMGALLARVSKVVSHTKADDDF